MKGFDRDHLVALLQQAWADGLPLAHNWKLNPFPAHARSIHAWCAAHQLDWGAPSGFPVQAAQRIERGHPAPRIRAFQEPTGKRRIMFSLSAGTNAGAYAAAAKVAALHGFVELDP